jgi:hypothetical protein
MDGGILKIRFKKVIILFVLIIGILFSIESVLAAENNSTQTISSMEGSADTTLSSVKGYWINSGPGEVNNINVSSLKKAGITDVFVLTYKEDPDGTLKPFLTAFKDSGIRIHAWITCFKDSKGNFFDPGSNPELMSYLTSRITFIASNYQVDGIHLDYVRYPGNAYKYSGGTATVTSFVKNIYSKIYQINQNSTSKPYIYLSAALMPELGSNAYYYGQDYGQLAKYLDMLIPMVYKGNYNQKTSWIGTCTKYIVQKAGGKPVIIGLQTYRSDKNPVAIPLDELNSDINMAKNNGAKGYVLFKYGLVDSKYTGGPVYSSLTINQIGAASKVVNDYISANGKLPSLITVGSKKITASQYLSLLLNSLIKISTGSNSSVVLKNFRTPKNPITGISTGNIYKSEYISLAKGIKYPMDVNGVGPGYVDSSLGKIGYKSIVYMYSRIIYYYNKYNALPSYISIK